MKIALALLAFSPLLLAAPTDKDLVVVQERSKRGTQNKTEEPKITEMHITSNIYEAFAETMIRSKVKNNGNRAQETVFFFDTKELAIVTDLVMEIGGTKYTGNFEDAGKKIYEQAVSGECGAARVNFFAGKKFTVNLNLEPQAEAVFYLTYNEILLRKKGRYEQVIDIHPKQPVDDLRADVAINEPLPLIFVATPSLRSAKDSEGVSPSPRIFRPNKTSALVSFYRDAKDQRHLGKEDEIGGPFVVQYDMEREENLDVKDSVPTTARSNRFSRQIHTDIHDSLQLEDIPSLDLGDDNYENVKNDIPFLFKGVELVATGSLPRSNSAGTTVFNCKPSMIKPKAREAVVPLVTPSPRYIRFG